MHEPETSTMGSKPRILVCAHSYAAVDELLKRCKQQEFTDGMGRKYRPDVMRRGLEKVSEDNKEVRSDALLRC